MRGFVGVLILIFLEFACKDSNSYSVSRIIDGNSIELTNGLIVNLDGVQERDENIKILDRYAKGTIHLYDRENNEIVSTNIEDITAIVYNADGDCINEILKQVSEIVKIDSPKNPEIKPELDRTILQMNLEGGVYTIPVFVNNTLMSFIFDTGASLISISNREASILYNQGSLTEEDIIGKSQFVDANGDISEGTIVNLDVVRIGDRILHNVLACVSEGQNVPLLLGQSALQKFGKVSIDYNKMEITFE